METRLMLNEPGGAVRELPIRELVELYPETMAVLDRYGLDLCCGGAHTVAEAAGLHGHDPAAVVSQVVRSIKRVRS